MIEAGISYIFISQSLAPWFCSSAPEMWSLIRFMEELCSVMCFLINFEL